MDFTKVEEQLRPGDLVFVKSKGFLPWAIRLFMRMYSKLKYGYVSKDIYNHMGVIGTFGTVRRVGESTAKGFPFRKLLDAYELGRWGRNVVVYRYNGRDAAGVDRFKINKHIVELSFDQTPYEFWNFIWWSLFIVSGFKIYLGSKGKRATKKMYCFESAIRSLNAGFKEPIFPNPQKITSVDVLESGKFKRIL